MLASRSGDGFVPKSGLVDNIMNTCEMSYVSFFGKIFL